MNLIMLMPCISIIMMNLFVIKFFELSKNSPKVMQVLWLINFIEVIIFLTNMGRFFGIDYLIAVEVQIQFMIGVYLFMTLIGIYVASRQLIGSYYFLIGSISYSVFMIIGLLYTSGKIESSNLLALSTLIGVLLDMIFISLALSKKIEIIKQEKEASEKILLEHSKILQINTIISNMVHQLKTPIIHLGAISANISMIFDKYSNLFSKKESLLIPELNSLVSYMDKTILTFKDLYKSSSIPNQFNLTETINNVFLMYSSSFVIHNIKCKKSLIDIQILNFEEALIHTLNAIIENAIEIFEDRKIQNKVLDLTTESKNNKTIITIIDNAGGIKTNPLDNIFKIFYSEKKAPSSGLGLALAKSLIENKMHGTINVSNTLHGAKFTIELPNRL